MIMGNWQCWADLGFSKNCWFPHLGKQNQNQRTIGFQVFQKNLKRTGWVYRFFVGSLTSSFSPGQSQGQVFEILASTGYAPICLHI
jgi:hypothetical protein